MPDANQILVATLHETATTVIEAMSKHAAVIHGCSTKLAEHRADGCDSPEVRDVNSALDVIELQALTIKVAFEKLQQGIREESND